MNITPFKLLKNILHLLFFNHVNTDLLIFSLLNTVIEKKSPRNYKGHGYVEFAPIEQTCEGQSFAFRFFINRRLIEALLKLIY